MKKKTESRQPATGIKFPMSANMALDAARELFGRHGEINFDDDDATGSRYCVGIQTPRGFRVHGRSANGWQEALERAAVNKVAPSVKKTTMEKVLQEAHDKYSKTKQQTDELFAKANAAVDKVNKKSDRVVSVVNDVIFYLENNREVATQRLFPGASDDTQDTWRKRSVVEFWKWLDKERKRRLIEIAVERYAK